MKCKHYKGDGYTYELPNEGGEIDLCAVCEMHLLAEMKKQEVLESKAAHLINVKG